MLTGGDYQTEERLRRKLAMLPALDLAGRTVLDVGCDHGAWCWWAAAQGASRVVGLDRGRNVPGVGFVDLAARNRAIADQSFPQCEFRRYELGRQWHELGRFDVVLMLSMYHHVYQLVGDHAPIWYWLWRHCAGQVIWENPVSKADPVAAEHVSHPYEEADIRYAAERWFHVERVGPGHIPTRVVWRCIPRDVPGVIYEARKVAGAGGAAPAWEYDRSRRVAEVEHILGVRCAPGSLNLELAQPFPWALAYYRAEVLDVANRGAGLDGEWLPRWARFYPITIGGGPAYLFRFEGESYPPTFAEVIAGRRLRDDVADSTSFRAIQ